MGNIKTSDVSMQWSNVLEMVYESRIDSVGLNERVNSLASRSIKKDSKLEALNMIVTMCDLTTLEGEDTEGKISQMVAKAIKPNPLDTSVPSVAAVCVYDVYCKDSLQPDLLEHLQLLNTMDTGLLSRDRSFR